MAQLKKSPASKHQPVAKSVVKERDLESFRDISEDVIESDFVPYAALFDPDTIATKDGELLQIIKITGLGFDARAQGDLRQMIRQAIRTCIPGTDYAIWLTTMRRKQTLLSQSRFPDEFSGKLDEAWRATHPTSASYVNELYISVVKAGQQSGLRNMQAFIQSLWPPRDKTMRLEFLDAALNELSATTAQLLQLLRPFGARRLTMVEREGVYYSEQVEFLEKLINLEARPMPVPTQDLSQVLTSGEITFGHNAMEVRTAEGHRRFAAILTLKEYKESTLAGIDKFLDIPCELIVSQCFDFIGGEQAREEYTKQARYLSISGDKELAQWIEIDRLMQDKTATSKAFGQQQTSLFLIAPSVRQLESNVRLIQKSLNRLGMVVVREDLKFEECYWAQLPANFTFVTRKHSVDTGHLAGFANVQTAPMGNAHGSAWGPPVSLLTTVQDAPYFFNFHREANAHTIILGKPGSGRTSFTHFLMAQARKLPIAIWHIDAHGKAGNFIRAMGGEIRVPGASNCKFNPFQMPDNQVNREFLALFLSTLVDPYGAQLNRSSLAFFQSMVDGLFALPKPQRRISNLIPMARDADPVLANSLARFAAGGPFGDLFDMPEDQFATEGLISWDLSRWMGDDATRIPLTSYLLQRLTMALNGKPTLIVMDEGFEVLDTPLFAARAAGWCDFLTQNNSAVLISSENIESSAARSFTQAVAAKAASIFAMADSSPGAEYKFAFALTDADIATLSYIYGRDHQLLMKRGGEAHVLRMNLATLGPAMLDVLSGGAKFAARTPADTLAELMGYNKQAV